MVIWVWEWLGEGSMGLGMVRVGRVVWGHGFGNGKGGRVQLGYGIGKDGWERRVVDGGCGH